MTDQANVKAYTITLTPKGDIDTTPNSAGTPKMRFRATYTAQGQQKDRTVLAQGKAFEAVKDMIKVGEPVALRVIFDRAPANEDGKPGGEYLTVLGVPLPKAA